MEISIFDEHDLYLSLEEDDEPIPLDDEPIEFEDKDVNDDLYLYLQEDDEPIDLDDEDANNDLYLSARGNYNKSYTANVSNDSQLCKLSAFLFKLDANWTVKEHILSRTPIFEYLGVIITHTFDTKIVLFKCPDKQFVGIVEVFDNNKKYKKFESNNINNKPTRYRIPDGLYQPPKIIQLDYIDSKTDKYWITPGNLKELINERYVVLYPLFKDIYPNVESNKIVVGAIDKVDLNLDVEELNVIGCEPPITPPVNNVSITLTGTGFTPKFYVYIQTKSGNFYPKSQRYISSIIEPFNITPRIEFTIDLQKCPEGLHDIVVENSRNAITIKQNFIEVKSYSDKFKLPVIINITPSSVYNNGFSIVKILGNNVNNVNRVTLGHLEADAIRFISISVIEATFNLSYLNPGSYDLTLYVNKEYVIHTPFVVKSAPPEILSIGYEVGTPLKRNEIYQCDENVESLMYINGYNLVKDFELVFMDLRNEKYYPTYVKYISFTQIECIVVFPKSGYYTFTYTTIPDRQVVYFNSLIRVIPELPMITSITPPLVTYNERVKIIIHGTGFKPRIKLLPDPTNNYVIHSFEYRSSTELEAIITFLHYTESNMSGYRKEYINVENIDGGKTVNTSTSFNYILISRLRPIIKHIDQEVIRSSGTQILHINVERAFNPKFKLISDVEVNGDIKSNSGNIYEVLFHVTIPMQYSLKILNEDGSYYIVKNALKVYDWGKGFPSHVTKIDKLIRINRFNILILDIENVFVLSVCKKLENFYYFKYSIKKEPFEKDLIKNNTIIIHKTESIYESGYVEETISYIKHNVINVYLNTSEYDLRKHHLLIYKAIMKLQRMLVVPMESYAVDDDNKEDDCRKLPILQSYIYIPEDHWNDNNFVSYLNHVGYTKVSEYDVNRISFKDDDEILELYFDYCEKRYFFS